jgi:hypothetical protein
MPVCRMFRLGRLRHLVVRRRPPARNTPSLVLRRQDYGQLGINLSMMEGMPLFGAASRFARIERGTDVCRAVH